MTFPAFLIWSWCLMHAYCNVSFSCSLITTICCLLWAHLMALTENGNTFWSATENLLLLSLTWSNYDLHNFFLCNVYFYTAVVQSHRTYRLKVMLVLLLWLKTVLWHVKIWLEIHEELNQNKDWNLSGRDEQSKLYQLEIPHM